MAAAIYSTTSQQGIDINNVFLLDTTAAPEYPAPPFLPGELAWGTDGSEWVYATASVTIASGSAVYFNPTPGSWSVALLSNTNKALLGDLVGVVGGSQGSMFVPAPSGTQSGTYFWVQRAGNAPKLLNSASISANTALHTSGTGGQLGPTGGAGTSATVNGVVFSTIAPTAATGYPAVLNYPTIGAAD